MPGVFVVNQPNVQLFSGSSMLLGQREMSASVPVTLASDQSSVPVRIQGYDPKFFISSYLLSGSFYNMKVDGSSTNHVFTFSASGSLDIAVLEIRFLASALMFDWSGAGFGKRASPGLTNGIKIEMWINSGSHVPLNTIHINEDLLRTFGETPVISQAGNNDVIVSSYKFSEGGLILKAGTTDRIDVTIGDDLTNGALGLNYISATVFAVR